MAWFNAHSAAILGSLLAVSEGLSLIFPSSSGFGGILAAIVKVGQALSGPSAPPSK